jgi:acyl transferase domain-containing protein/NAD(P)-dependent dehydrogenase (short-subunit alcohol dehydrogenase family)/acyl carrier protein
MSAIEFPREHYLKDVESHVVQIFNRLPLQKQPRYIAQMGCGNGTLLKRLYQSIQDNSGRGSQLQTYPLTLLGIDRDPAALKETAETLRGLPHMTLGGDVHDSQRLSATLAANEIEHTGAILYIGTFEDGVRCNDSKFGSSSEIAASDARSTDADWSVNYPETPRALSAWKKHFESWSELIGSGDLLLLEFHRPSKETRQQSGTARNSHRLTVHDLSHRHSVSAESFLILAAGTGFFAKANPKRYPKTAGDCRATLTHFEKRNYRIRHAGSGDLEILFELESLCWSKTTRTPDNRIQARIREYPQGQFVLERAGRVVGVIYSQRIEGLGRLQRQTASRVHALHTPSGEVVQLLALNIHPEFQNLSLGDQLLEFMLQRCSVVKGVRSVCGVTICKEYRSGRSVPFAEYIHSRDENGRIRDSVLSFHESHGAAIEKALPGYRPEDVANEGFGVLVHYDIHRRVPGSFRTNGESQPQVSFSVARPDVPEFIRATILKFLGKEGEQAFSLDRPLMEMGLDSADLLQLRAHIVQAYAVELEPAFFFDHNTSEKVIAYLQEKLSDATEKRSLSVETADRTKTAPASKDIAIVGMSCRLPGNVNTPDELWSLLEEKGSGITELPQDRFRWPEDIDPREKHRGINLGGFIRNIDCFDAPFFRIAAREAEGMDPQQRILLELAWTCLEEGGVSPHSLKGSNTGVFIGASGSDYARLLLEKGIDVEAHHGTGSSMAVLANRLSYFFDFSGPSLQIDTACSSSLVAVHSAIQSLFFEECSQALVGGVHLICHPGLSVAYYKAGMLSKDGRCQAFDRKANGYVRSEGAVMLLLKPLPRAISDGNLIHAVIKGSAINHGGLSGGLTVPSPEKQKELLERAWNAAGITPATLGYMEAHGTGTRLGDPIEISGMQRAFSQFDKPGVLPTSSCGVGSLKSNLGHLEAAAGIAGLLKAVLCLKHQRLLASPNFENLNPEIQLDAGPLFIVARHQRWHVAGQEPRRAGVSSFGSGGANAHVVVEEFPRVRNSGERRTGPFVFVLSARDGARLRAYASGMVSWLKSKAGEASSLFDLTYTLQVGRSPLDERLSIVVSEKKELLQKLSTFCRNEHAGADTYHENIKNPSSSMKILMEQRNRDRVIQDAVQERDLAELARLWTAGAVLNWDLLYGEKKPERTSLPTYRFAKERYWLPGTESERPGKEHHEANAVTRTIRFVKKQWQPCSAIPSSKTDQAIAIFATADTKELALHLFRYFPRSEVLYVQNAETRPPGLPREAKSYDGVIDLLGCGREQTASLNWITHFQDLIGRNERKKLMLLCVTRGLESYRNADINLSGAARAGLYRMLQSEYSHLRSRHMDAEPDSEDSALAEEIATEFLADSDEPEVCYREKKRYRAYLDEYPSENDPDLGWEFPADHVLWITGGTRGLGYLCARHFVARYGVKRLVLCGRDTIPPRKQWRSYKQNRSLGRKIEAIEALEAQGVHVAVLSVSLTDENALERHLHRIKAAMGPTGGIIHCAGVVGSDPAFVRKSTDGFRQVLSPKVAGLDAIYNIFRHEPLRTFVLFSSVSAVSPVLAAGRSDYAMANAYMDYAAEAWSRTCPIVSIQWPSWKQTGMGEIKSLAYQRTGLLSHTDEEGLRMLDQILSRKLGPVILPAVIDPALWRPDVLLKPAIHEASTTASPAARAITADSAAIPAALLSAAQGWLIGLFSKELKMTPSSFDPETSFRDYGVDSIFIAQVVQRIERELEGVALDPSAFIEHSTIKGLATYLIQTHPGVLTRLLLPHGVAQINEPPFVADPVPGLPVLHRNRSNGSGTYRRDKIAIVGMACHFPDAGSTSEYWENLKSGKDSIREVPQSRWDWNKYCDPAGQKSGGTSSKWGAFLTGIEDFDPGYFDIPESLARQIDPLQRQWLEVSAEALADAGYEKKDLWGRRVGVFAGARTSNFFYKLDEIGKNVLVGTGQNFIAAHLAHIYNFKGPNMVIDTACSSSLTAVHIAAQSIHNDESEMALAGGVEILLDESLFLSLGIANILSPDGRCKAFDAAANGIGLGEGCGVLVLKPLRKAIQDQNKIYGVIDGSAINNDGNTMGVTTPNPDAQRELIETAIAAADIDPRTITYIETHGTGTLIGDPIELKGITSIFASHTTRRQFCGVGSVKSNIGHLLSAAGAASIIKVLLAMTHRQLVPTLHCHNPNPRFDFEKSPLYPVTRLQEWTHKTGTLRSGISAFGLGGNNAHVIVSNQGVPASRQAALEPKGSRVIFHRRRYWPEMFDGGYSAEAIRPMSGASAFSEEAEDRELMKFLNAVEL